MSANATHLFFDLDKTIAPSRQPMLPEMFELLSALPQDIIIVSGQGVERIKEQSKNIMAIRLGLNGNHAIDRDGTELWKFTLSESQREEILAHIAQLTELLDTAPNPDWTPIEDRGGQVTFSPIGNTAPLELKMKYDPNHIKRDRLLAQAPFVSRDLIVKLGGSTSLDYMHKNHHKGTNVQKLIDYRGWGRADCVYFGDGLFPGGNDEAVIGVVETVAVEDHLHTYSILTEAFTQKT